MSGGSTKTRKIKMPIKYKPSERVVNRSTKKVTTVHHYIRNIPRQALLEGLNKDSTPPKVRQKIRNELVRRDKEANNGSSN